MEMQEWNEDYLGENFLSPLTIVLFSSLIRVQAYRICTFSVPEYLNISIFKNFNMWAGNLFISLIYSNFDVHFG